MLVTDPTKTAQIVSSRILLQFSLDSPKEVTETYEKLITARHKSFKKTWNAFWRQKFAQITEPDKNNVGFFAEL